MVADCDTEAGLREYLIGHNSLSSQQVWNDKRARPGDDLFRLNSVRVLDEKRQPGTTFYSSKPLLVEFDFDLTAVNSSLCIGFDLSKDDGTCAFRSYQTDVDYDQLPVLRPGSNQLVCTVDNNFLNAGTYTINIKVSLHMQKWIAVVDGAAQFDVIFDHGTSPFLKTGTRPGLFAPVLRWNSINVS